MADATYNLNAVADLWFRWLEAVRGVVDQRGGGRTLSAHDYRNLQSSLLKACQSCNDADADMAERLRQVKRIVSPWVSFESLMTADRKFLGDILKQAEVLSAALRKKARPRATKKKTATSKKRGIKPIVWLLAFAVGLGVGWFLLSGNAAGNRAWSYEIQLLIVRMKYLVSRFSFLQIFSAVAILILLIVGPLMYRTRKS